MQDSFAASPRTTTITPDSVNLSAADFLPEFISPSAERRATARLYLLGVLDSTEGKTWCSYNHIKTVTINELVVEYLQKQSAEKLKMRASALIEEALEHHFPCIKRATQRLFKCALKSESPREKSYRWLEDHYNNKHSHRLQCR